MRLLHVAFLASSLAACASDDGNSLENPDGTYNCEKETRDDEFSLGLEKLGASNKLDFKLMTADPAPPASGDNKWVMQITDKSMGGAVLPGASLQVAPFMPDHQHGSPIAATMKDMGGGMYEIDRINMWMPGLWETTIQATSGATTDAVVYRFCIPQ